MLGTSGLNQSPAPTLPIAPKRSESIAKAMNTQPGFHRDLESVAEAALRLGISQRFLRTLIKQGRVPVRRLGRRVLIPVAWVPTGDMVLDIAS